MRCTARAHAAAATLQTLHQKAAEALEASYGDKAAEVADVLAHHYARTRRSDKWQGIGRRN